jgi:hypothetical protein
MPEPIENTKSSKIFTHLMSIFPSQINTNETARSKELEKLIETQ